MSQVTFPMKIRRKDKEAEEEEDGEELKDQEEEVVIGRSRAVVERFPTQH